MGEWVPPQDRTIPISGKTFSKKCCRHECVARFGEEASGPSCGSLKTEVEQRPFFEAVVPWRSWTLPALKTRIFLALILRWKSGPSRAATRREKLTGL